MLNSNLMDTLKKDQIDVAIVYSGNPCQLAIMHVLGIPFIYFDLEGFTDETIVASGAPWNLDAFSSQRAPTSAKSTEFGAYSQILNGLLLLKETVVQSGYPMVAKVLSPRYRSLDGPVTRMFAEDYEIRKKFPAFPDVNHVYLDLLVSRKRNAFRSSKRQKRTSSIPTP